MLSSASLKHFYLLWERNFPVEWPDPSHPGTGHLWRRREIKKNSCQRKVFFSKRKGKSNMWMTERGKILLQIGQIGRFKVWEFKSMYWTGVCINQSIFNILRWEDGTTIWSSRRLMVQCFFDRLRIIQWDSGLLT